MNKAFAVLGLGVAALFSTTAYAEDATPQQLLNLVLVTGAVVDYCKLTVDSAIQDKMVAEVGDLQKQLSMSDDDLQAAGKQAADTVAQEKPGCSETGDVVKSARQLMDLVSSQ